jgi:bifunctional non-homologous end joining protein LigD
MPSRSPFAPIVICPPPMLAREVNELPQGEDWLYEFLWGGERVRALKQDSGVRLVGKDGRDLSNRFPRVAAAVARLRASAAFIDGEVLLLDCYREEAIRRLAHGADDIAQARVAFLVFDLLEHNGIDLRAQSLAARRLRLASVVEGTSLLVSPQVHAAPAAAQAEAARLGLAGVVAKRGGSAYRPNSVTIEWVKVSTIPAVHQIELKRAS